MGNSSASFLPQYSCNDANLSRNSVTPEYWETSSISDAYSANATATAVIMLLLLLVGLPANLILIISIIHQRLYKEATHILLLNLAISDLLVCLLVMPFTIVAGFAGEYIFGNSDYTRCQACQMGMIFITLTVFSVLVLGLISIDRFVFIKFPLRHPELVTVPRVVVVVLLAWGLSILQAILPLIGFGEYKLAYTISSCTVSFKGKSSNIYYGAMLIALATVPVIITIVTNIWITCIVRKQIMKVYRTRRTITDREELKRYNENMRKKRSSKQFVLMRAFGAILVGNLIAWLPTTVHVVVTLVIDLDQIPIGVFLFVFLTFISHSVMHPLIEGFFIPETRKTFKAVLGINLCRKYLCKHKKKGTGSSVRRPRPSIQSCDSTLDILDREMTQVSEIVDTDYIRHTSPTGNDSCDEREDRIEPDSA